MKTKHIYLNDLHFEHKLWRNELSFFKDEAAVAAAEANPTAIDHEHFEDQTELRDKVIRFRQLYSELKKDCNTFVAKHL